MSQTVYLHVAVRLLARVAAPARDATDATTTVAPFLILLGATYFFSEFGPNTTRFVYPAGILPVRVRTTSHGITAASGKVGAFVSTYALTGLPTQRYFTSNGCPTDLDFH
jgi:hypothetical protein